MQRVGQATNFQRPRRPECGVWKGRTAHTWNIIVPSSRSTHNSVKSRDERRGGAGTIWRGLVEVCPKRSCAWDSARDCWLQLLHLLCLISYSCLIVVAPLLLDSVMHPSPVSAGLFGMQVDCPAGEEMPLSSSACEVHCLVYRARDLALCICGLVVVEMVGPWSPSTFF